MSNGELLDKFLLASAWRNRSGRAVTFGGDATWRYWNRDGTVADRQECAGNTPKDEAAALVALWERVENVK